MERTLGYLLYAIHKNRTESAELGGVRNAACQFIFSTGGSLRPFEGSPRRCSSRGPLAHTFTRLIQLNDFVVSCAILKSFSFLSFGN